MATLATARTTLLPEDEMVPKVPLPTVPTAPVPPPTIPPPTTPLPAPTPTSSPAPTSAPTPSPTSSPSAPDAPTPVPSTSTPTAAPPPPAMPAPTGTPAPAPSPTASTPSAPDATPQQYGQPVSTAPAPALPLPAPTPIPSASAPAPNAPAPVSTATPLTLAQINADPATRNLSIYDKYQRMFPGASTEGVDITQAVLSGQLPGGAQSIAPAASVTAGGADSAVPITVPQPVLSSDTPGGVTRPPPTIDDTNPSPVPTGPATAPPPIGQPLNEEPLPPPIVVNDQPPAPPPGDGPVTTFDENNNLRNAQINPLASARLAALQGAVDQSRVALTAAPNLRDAAQEHLRLFEEQTQPGFDMALRGVGQKAAALGRIGAGMTTNDLTGVLQSRENALSQARRQLSADLAGAEESQRLGRVGALSGLEGQLYDQESGSRGELRGERDYQAGQAREAVQNRVQQRLLEDQLLNSEFARTSTAAELGLRGASEIGGDGQGATDEASRLAEQMALEEYLKRIGQLPQPARTPSRPPDEIDWTQDWPT